MDDTGCRWNVDSDQRRGTAIRAFTSRAGDPAAVAGDPFDIDVSAQILQPGDDRPVDGGGGDGGPTGPVPPAGYSAKSSLNIAFVGFHGESDTASADAAAAGFTEASTRVYGPSRSGRPLGHVL